MPTLKLNVESFERHCEKAGLRTRKAVARRLEIDEATLSRVMNGQAAPGPKFVAGAIVAFGTTTFGHIFRVVD